MFELNAKNPSLLVWKNDILSEPNDRVSSLHRAEFSEV